MINPWERGIKLSNVYCLARDNPNPTEEDYKEAWAKDFSEEKNVTIDEARKEFERAIIRQEADEICAKLEEENRRVEKAEVPQDLKYSTLKNFNATTDEKIGLLTAAKKMLEEKNFLTLVLCGTNGTGKTHIGVSLIREFGGKYRMSNSICTEYQDAKRKYSESAEALIKNYSQEAFLVIDELGFTVDGFNDSPLIQLILMNRISAGKKTVLISNKDKEQSLNDLGPKIYDRLKTCGLVLELKDRSYREQQFEERRPA